MSWVTVLCASVAAACLTLSAVHALIWLRARRSPANLGVAVLALGVALFTWGSHATMRATTPDEFLSALWWLQIPLFLMVTGIVIFIHHHLGTGRRWLAHLVWVSRTLILLVNFFLPSGVEFERITGIRQVPLLGEQVSVASGDKPVWHWVGQATIWLLFVYVVDAAVRLWRRGGPDDRRRAVMIGGSTAMFVGLGTVWATLLFNDIAPLPHVEFLFFLAFVCAMGYELSGEVLRAANLARELQLSEQAAHLLSGRLINAQEDERRRIARDLHDDFNQRLALLSVEIEMAGRVDAGVAEPPRLAPIAAQIRELSAEVHKLSYQLHPAKLDQLGLVAAARAWCRDLSRQSAIELQFAARDVPDDLTPEVRLCLYRVLQEATRNIVRHSEASAGRVELSCNGQTLSLVVCDAGRGFGPDTGQAGLGLLSMQERLKLVRGSLRVTSAPGAGTRVEASIPVA